MTTIRPRPPVRRATRVLVLADVRIYREALAAALRREPGVDVVGALARVPDDLAALRPDMVLYDVSRPDALRTVRGLVSGTPAVKVIAVAIAEQEQDLLAYAEAGVSGWVTCEQPVEDAVIAVLAAAHEEMICSPRFAASLLRHVASLAADRDVRVVAPETSLTRREVQIVRLIDRGMSNKQIAGALQIEVATVKNHVHNVLEKLQVERRGEAAARLRSRREEPSATIGI